MPLQEGGMPKWRLPPGRIRARRAVSNAPGKKCQGHHLWEQNCIMFMRHEGGFRAVCRRAIEREIRM
jgi:hypothetical protein